MGKGKKTLRACCVFIVMAAIVAGIFYYYGQMQENSVITEGTLI